MERAREVLQAHWDLDVEEGLREQVNQVVDFDGDETTCPACLTVFSTEKKRCPECDLNFGE